jgi:hypothetical protein
LWTANQKSGTECRLSPHHTSGNHFAISDHDLNETEIIACVFISLSHWTKAYRGNQVIVYIYRKWGLFVPVAGITHIFLSCNTFADIESGCLVLSLWKWVVGLMGLLHTLMRKILFAIRQQEENVCYYGILQSMVQTRREVRMPGMQTFFFLRSSAYKYLKTVLKFHQITSLAQITEWAQYGQYYSTNLVSQKLMSKHILPYKKPYRTKGTMAWCSADRSRQG